ncbi:MAG: hypothetical protein ACETWR_12725 [Anaerolineae bacterium]
MTTKQLLINFGKLLLCSLAFILGVMIGGMVAALLGLQQPPMPEGVDSSFAFLLLLLESPVMALALALVARGLGGRLLPRALTLSFFTWAAYTLNTVIESLAFTTTSVAGALFTTVSFLVPSISCGTAVALLFPSGEKGKSLAAIAKEFFGRRTVGAWVWRIGVVAVAFVPIYLFFGSLVAPITAEYYQQGMYGLRQPSWDEILVVLSVRSVLFLLACLPVVVMWQRSNRSLFLSLGFALFVLVGFLYMLAAYYMPLTIRVPHTLEILADSFTHAGVLVVLLAKGGAHLVQTVKESTMP